MEIKPVPVELPENPNAVQVPEETKKKVRKVAQQFEAMFTQQMITAMRKTVVKQGLVPESHAERVYQSMLDSEYATKMAESNQLGLSDLVYRQLLKNTAGR